MPPVTAAAFPQYFNSTRATVAKPVDYIINLSQKSNYAATNFIKGKSPFEMAKGGSSVQEVVHVADNGSFGAFTPGQFDNLQFRGQTAVLNANWRFYRSSVFWTDFEYNTNTRDGTDRERVKNFKTLKDQESYTSHLNGVDGLLFARPDFQKMENAPTGTAADSAAAFSIPALLTEDNVRWRPPASASDGGGTWSSNNILGQDVTVNTWHRNAVRYYDPADIFDEGQGILPAFDRLWLDIKRDPPSDAGKLMQGYVPSDLLIFTNNDGYTKLQQIGRQYQRWNDAKDMAMPNPKFDGCDVIYAPQLDTEALEQTRGASATYTGQAYQNPRYFVVNRKFLGPIWNTANVMQAAPAIRGGLNQPDVTGIWTVSQMNIFMSDRRAHGVIAPAA